LRIASLVPSATECLFALGLGPGVVEIRADGVGIRVEVPAEETLDERDGRLVIPASGTSIDDDAVRALRDGGQK